MFVSGWKFVDGISRVEIDGEDAYFSTRKTSQLPRVPLELPTKCVSFLSVGIHRPPLLFLPLFVYSTFERSRPSFHSRWTHTHTHTRGPENGNGDGGEFWKSPPMYFYKGFRSRLPWICMYFCANPDKSYRVTAKIASIYNTSPLEKIEFKSEKKKKARVSKRQNFSPFFPLLYFIHRDTFTERILRKCIVAMIIGNSTTQRN